MKILVIGSGGREHALGWKLRQSPFVDDLFFVPGNGGTSQLGTNINIRVHEMNELLSFVIKNKIDLTVVGPEEPLSLGIVDLFESKKQTIFGPSKLASQLESSKAWSASFMKKYAIPHPIFYTFTDYEKASSFITTHNPSYFVIKASGLAMGKGVFLPKTKKEAQNIIHRMMVQKEFGDAGKEVVIQEKLIGQEVSLMAIADGKVVIPFIPAQDHKRIFDEDKGPNTGGMGAYAPVSFITKKLLRQIQETILQPTIDGMRKEKIPYKGILYAGLMITDEGPKVLEYNVRFGDPETQPVMMLLKSDLLPLLISSIQGTLKSKRVIFHKQSSVCVVLASKGYPGSYVKGDTIFGIKKVFGRETQVFHAGTIEKEREILTNGGRVLGVTAIGKDMQYALKKAYWCIGKKGVSFKGMQYRTDIGRNALNTINKK